MAIYCDWYSATGRIALSSRSKRATSSVRKSWARAISIGHSARKARLDVGGGVGVVEGVKHCTGLGAISNLDLPNGTTLVAGEIVGNDDVTGLQRRRQHLLNIGQKELAIHRSIEQPRRVDTVMPQSGDEGHCVPVAVRHAPRQGWRVARPRFAACGLDRLSPARQGRVMQVRLIGSSALPFFKGIPGLRIVP